MLITEKLATLQPFNIDPCNYSNYRNLYTSADMSFSFQNRFPHSTYLLIAAEKYWIQHEQQHHHAEIITTLKRKKRMRRASPNCIQIQIVSRLR